MKTRALELALLLTFGSVLGSPTCAASPSSALLDPRYAPDHLNYLWLPLLFTAFIAFYVAQMFNEVWGMAMSTILQCFCADEEIYKGDKDAMYAGSDLKATVSNSNKGKFAKKSKVAAAPAEDEGDAVI